MHDPDELDADHVSSVTVDTPDGELINTDNRPRPEDGEQLHADAATDPDVDLSADAFGYDPDRDGIGEQPIEPYERTVNDVVEGEA